MTKHKWYDEIVAWAGGAEIEVETVTPFGKVEWVIVKTPTWLDICKYRIKPQPKEKKFLYAYFDLLTGIVVFNTTIQWSDANKNLELIGKIEVQND